MARVPAGPIVEIDSGKGQSCTALFEGPTHASDGHNLGFVRTNYPPLYDVKSQKQGVLLHPKTKALGKPLKHRLDAPGETGELLQKGSA